MQFLFNSDNQTHLGEDAATRVEELVGTRLSRIADRLTRVEVHVSDVNGPRDGDDDKRCAIEIRPKGMNPISATAQAPTIERAVASGADKILQAFDRQVGKRTDRKGR